METNREIKSMAAALILVAAVALLLNYLVVPQADRSIMSWAMGLLVTAILLRVWMRRDALAEKHGQDAAEDAASRAESLAKQAPEQAADDLTRIEGIGPVYQQVLREAGPGTFAALADKSTADLEAILKTAGRARPASIDTWAEQAAYAAQGDWEGLQTFQDSLDSGRRR